MITSLFVFKAFPQVVVGYLMSLVGALRLTAWLTISLSVSS